MLINKHGVFVNVDPMPMYYRFTDEEMNRALWRKSNRDLEKCIRDLFEVEVDMLVNIFDEDDLEEYQDKYRTVLEEYEKTLVKLKKLKRFKYLVPFDHYFAIKYKPISIYQKTILNDLQVFVRKKLEHLGLTPTEDLQMSVVPPDQDEVRLLIKTEKP